MEVCPQVMEVGETDLNNLLIDHSGKAISMNFIRYIWEQVRHSPLPFRRRD